MHNINYRVPTSEQVYQTGSIKTSRINYFTIFIFEIINTNNSSGKYTKISNNDSTKLNLY